jgi:diguanylate cyclase (GGDEF)-like protein
MPVLTMLEGEDASRSWTLGDKPLVLGRDLGCDIALADAKSSRRHARIQWINHDNRTALPEVWLEDLASTNGTWVNGRRVDEPVRLYERDKVVIGHSLFGFALHLDEQLEQLRRMVQRATTDSLTALLNGEALDRVLRREFERARRYTRPLSLIYLNLDQFTAVNDTHGTRVGDLVLRQIGRILRDNLRLCDLSARVGDDEFVVLLPETGAEGALVVAERLRKQVYEFPMMLGHDPVRVSVSVGVAPLDDTHAHPDTWLDCTSKAAYRAKELGGNRVLLAA